MGFIMAGLGVAAQGNRRAYLRVLCAAAWQVDGGGHRKECLKRSRCQVRHSAHCAPVWNHGG